ncbi:MAG: hypothetical protein KBG11_02705 [Bacteroidia bacterium]|nr:hypothetical protein [Bacteroidia bacterium]
MQKNSTEEDLNPLNNLSYVIVPPKIDSEVPEYEYHEDAVAANLNDFWANFSAYVGVTNETGITPDLESKVCYKKAAYYFHYVLNVALVELDSIYEEVDSNEFLYNLPIDLNDEITKYELCQIIDQATNDIRADISGLSTPYKIRDIDIIDRTDASGSIIVKYKVVKGNLISTSDMSADINLYKTDIGPLYWITKYSYDNSRYGSSKTFYTGNLLGIWTSPSSTNKSDAYYQLPDGIPAHKLLTNRNIFWPDPTAQIMGWLPAYPINTKPVKSLPFLNYYFDRGIENTLKAIPPTEVVDCNTPGAAHYGLTPNSTHLVSSSILGWHELGDNTDINISTDVRKISSNSFNYYYYQRRNVINYYQNTPNLINQMNFAKSTFGGFYALTDLLIEPNEDINQRGNCLSLTCMAGFCDNNREYVTALKFQHYTLQSIPSNLRTYL